MTVFEVISVEHPGCPSPGMWRGGGPAPSTARGREPKTQVCTLPGFARPLPSPAAAGGEPPLPAILHALPAEAPRSPPAHHQPTPETPAIWWAPTPPVIKEIRTCMHWGGCARQCWLAGGTGSHICRRMRGKGSALPAATARWGVCVVATRP